MKQWTLKIKAKHREKQRQRLLSLIGRDIDNIARDAYHEGCYVTEKRMRLEKEMEFRHLMAENDKLREIMIEHASFAMPTITIPLDEQEPK